MILERKHFVDTTPPSVLRQISTQTADQFFKVFDRVAPIREAGRLCVGLTRPRHEEISLQAFEAGFLRRGARLCYPRIVGESEMEFHEVADPGAYHWRRGVFGIEEPDEDLPRVAAEKMDWILVPGVLFGKSGERIGMGRGFYDRFLKEAVNAVKVGVAYEFQVKPNLPQENWDARMDWVVTAWEVIQVRA